MKFRTEIEITPYAPEARIGYENRILALGSCFAQEMTARLGELRFICTTNPTGILFNPASAAATLRTFSNPRPVLREELIESGGLWAHFGFHGSRSHPDPEAALTTMNTARHTGAKALHEADRVILTFGTAWVYEHHGAIVANCHRRPAQEFVRRRLSVAEIVTDYNNLLCGPLANKQVILSVSPVRHLGDGLAGNAVSKAVLRLAAEELAECHPNVRYFPAFEILNDDLRDYRFYADDLAHPAPQAVEYVWEKFAQTALTDHAKRILPQVAQIVAAAAHRPQHPDSDSFRTFCRAQLEHIGALPEVDFSHERAYFEKYLE